ncbi:SGNH/GDSL hydrolase family protein [Lysobacter sp. K5869]|uniref:SGNH/GDSL hydrolase family protein n=1 Tax=Lysobacter sp. K5869 TaxID=2820808 RepID=UPI001C06309A|nr:SGNH/GDSL hydrolase family protein [Lysobacter sp. K5869]QWP78096.1 SGNH/GDSL hydrolase family protein [Lysobacter sp. K5869]
MALSYLALGDSYTIGEAVPEAGRWPVQLAAGLRARGIELAAPRIIATTGWTTDELALALDLAEPLGEWDFVSLLIGVNNQYRGRSAAQYAGEYRELLERAIGYARGRPERVLALAIPDWGATPFGAQDKRGPATIGAELDVFNITASEICARHGVAFVDIGPLSRELAADAAMLAEDGLHPSARMYERWTELALPAAQRSLAQA